ncbi:MAG: transporter [Deltaproteobacteria bacterium]|nr:transporter [Deltaproteobacteria bacterium]
MKNKRMGLFSILLMMLSLAPFARAEEAMEKKENLPLVTDRPSFSDSAVTVPEGHVLFEFGAGFAHDAAGDGLTLAMPLIRYGMTEGMEARLGLPALQMLWPAGSPDETKVGTLDLGFRFVYKLSEFATAGFQPFACFPLRDDDYGSSGVAAGLKLVWALGLTDWMEVAGNFGIIFTGLGSDSVQDQEYLASLVLGFALAENWAAFVEGYGLIPERDADLAAAGLNVGLSWRMSPVWQLDAFLGSDLNADEAVSLGFGGSYLW